MKEPLKASWVIENDLFLRGFSRNVTVAESDYAREEIFGDEDINNLSGTPMKRRRRQRKRRGNNRSDTMSPSAESQCSLTSLTSSGISSAGSSMQILEDMEMKSNFSTSPTSSAASCIGLEEGVDEAFFDCTSFTSLTSLDSEEQCHEWSAKPKTKKGKKTRSLPKHQCWQNTILKEYFNQQKLFYRTIYEQQFAALSPNSKAKADGLNAPHQHLGIPPVPPPTTSFSDYESFITEYANSYGPCEELFFDKMRKHSIQMRQTSTKCSDPLMTPRVVSSKSDGYVFDLKHSTVGFFYHSWIGESVESQDTHCFNFVFFNKNIRLSPREAPKRRDLFARSLALFLSFLFSKKEKNLFFSKKLVII